MPALSALPLSVNRAQSAPRGPRKRRLSPHTWSIHAMHALVCPAAIVGSCCSFAFSDVNTPLSAPPPPFSRITHLDSAGIHNGLFDVCSPPKAPKTLGCSGGRLSPLTYGTLVSANNGSGPCGLASGAPEVVAFQITASPFPAVSSGSNRTVHGRHCVPNLHVPKRVSTDLLVKAGGHRLCGQAVTTQARVPQGTWLD